MQKFIPREKMSKKARRQLDNAQRQTWGINPVSRVTKDKKKYDRKALRRIDDDAGLCCNMPYPILFSNLSTASSSLLSNRFLHAALSSSLTP